MTLYTTQMDTVFDDTIEDTLELLTEGTTIMASVVNPSGPGGGWPVVDFTGTEDDLRALLMNHYAFDADEVDDFIYPV